MEQYSNFDWEEMLKEFFNHEASKATATGARGFWAEFEEKEKRRRQANPGHKQQSYRNAYKAFNRRTAPTFDNTVGKVVCRVGEYSWAGILRTFKLMPDPSIYRNYDTGKFTPNQIPPRDSFLLRSHV